MLKKKRNKFLIVLIALLVVFIAINSNSNSTLDNEESGFSVRDTASITKVFIADNGINEALLQRTRQGWLVNKKFPANKRSVDFLLETIKKIKVKSPVSKASRNNVVKRLAGSAVKVEIYQNVPRINLFNRVKLFYHEKRTKVFFVGDVTQNNLGTYMLMEGAENPYIVYIPGFRGFVSVRFSPKPDDWKSHIVFNKNLADIKSVKVENHKNPNQSFEVNIIDAMGNYDVTRLSDGSAVSDYDTLKLLNFLTSFKDLRYESRLNAILPPQRIDSILNTNPIYQITLIDVHHDTTKVIMYNKNKLPDAVTKAYEQLVPVDLDRFYGSLNNGQDFVLMQYYTFDKVLRPLSYYEKK